VAVVGIAIWSVGATNRRERRRWVLDQEKAEWRELLNAIAPIYKAIPLAFSKQFLDSLVKDSSAPAKYLLEVAIFKCEMDTVIFTEKAVKTLQLSEKFDELIKFAKTMKIIKDSTGKFEAFERSDMDSYLTQFNSLVESIHVKAVSDLNS
jgi:hypothetical protein